MTRELTPKGSATRQRIIEGAAAEIRELGVVTTTLDDVRRRTATSKSQLFHYFPGGREELLLAVARYEADRVLTDQQPQLGDLTSWHAWEEWREVLIERYRRQGWNCPLSAVVAQLGRSTPGARAVVTEMLDRWQAEIAAGVRAMQAQHEIDAELDADQTAAALLAGIQGGVVIMLSTGRLTHLEAALDVAIRRLRDSRPADERRTVRANG
ncbi:TetR/AcrR family transcriptional regulator [Planotetraspora kaengkrachanensis]|uniref:TetR family transcriptional regulator n=1 Tax=Planotetraspora kaengkrachanensis TaxID=575193 RepID=A0A8J3LVB5_9ACTN|nr:TetR/AcrR family transcriptional regulator [Planotetraspora kaengkrachanensis]GIG79012.1 TetR family transcriptional regulator [Planotetraspora kaengkrachanensis]